MKRNLNPMPVYKEPAFKLFTAMIGAMIAVIFLFTVVACAPVVETVYVEQSLTHPPRPVLPKVMAAELECVSQETYQKLFDRQRGIVEYATILETIIDSTAKVETQ